MIGTGNARNAFTNNDQTLIDDPRLEALADNGGPTLTHALLPGSAAIDAGNNALLAPDTLDRIGAVLGVEETASVFST